MTHRLSLTALAASLLLLAACDKPNKAADSPAATGGEPAALIGDSKLSKTVFEFYVKNRTGKNSADIKPQQRQELLDQLIGLEVAAQQAIKDGLDRESDVASRLELTRLNLLAEAQVAKKLGDARPTEQELRAEYETQIAALPKTEYHVRHILVATEPYAQSLIEKLKGGADFAATARKESMDSSKENGGDLGWFNPTPIGPEFVAAVTALQKGEITAKPVKTEFGYHIIRLEDSRAVSPPEFDTVKERLPALVRQKKAQAYIDELKKATKIEKKI